MNQESQTAVMAIKMTQQLDAGNIIDSHHYSLQGGENYAQLSQKFAKMGADLIISIIDNIIKNPQQNLLNLTIPQSCHNISFAKKISKDDLQINWQKTSQEIMAQINGLSGYDEAYFIHKNEKIKIYAARLIIGEELQKIATENGFNLENFNLNNSGQIIGKKLEIVTFNQNGQINLLQPLILQKSGKKMLNLKDFLLGFVI